VANQSFLAYNDLAQGLRGDIGKVISFIKVFVAET
jgi:hypothetical protein